MTQKNLPNLFLPGVMKGGTTSLAATLELHPDVFLIAMKEPNFFAQRPESREKLYELLSPDSSTYKSVTPHQTIDYLEREVYEEAFQLGKDTRWRMDASAMYMASPDAIRLAQEMIPDAKFVTVLRNPYARAYSAFQYQQSRQREPAPTFAQAITEEREGKRDNWAYGWRYLHTSLYADQVERLFAAVPEENRLTLLMEEIVGEGGLDPIYDFLGLDDHRIDLVFENETLLPRGRLKRFAAKMLHNPRIGRPIRGLLPQSAIAFYRSVNAKMRDQIHKGGEKPGKITAEDRALLAADIEPDIDRLEKLLGRGLSIWRA